jgi:hypothetical protein
MKKKKPKIISLDREEFNKRVMELQRTKASLGLKSPDACIFYSYTDEYGTLIELVCNEKPAQLGHNLQSIH